MPAGFFSPSTLKLVQAPAFLVPRCGTCGLHKQCRTPKMEASGSFRKKIMIVGEAPGRDEDLEGKQFVGETGGLLKRTLASMGIDMRKDCLLDNSLRCRPPDNSVPDEKMVDYCRPNVLNTIRDHSPNVIILLGSRAIRSVITHAYKDDDVGGIKRWAGFQIPCLDPNAWICPTFHPSFVSRNERQDKGMSRRMFTRHLEAAVSITSRPWDEVPDYTKEVVICQDPSAAAKTLRKFLRNGGRVAFDYETDRLKPDMPGRRILSCSVCWEGKVTIAYPWLGEAIDATKEILLSDMPKIASNAKFEERWTRRVFGFRVRNWRWDTMIKAHALDCRRGISSIKFQAFVRLGQPDYDKHLEAMKKSREKGGNEVNSLREADMRQLLMYNGLDSLLEYKVAEMQAEQLGERL